ncbi:MAG: AAA family ATPase [Actinomycetes bacterium]
MLRELHVVGLGVIDDSTISFGPGLTALTGETGAGKTLLVDALDLVLGGRTKRGLVHSDRSALIEATFIDDDGTEVIVAREIPSDGRSRAWIDGRMASVAALADRSIGLCDIHGQHEHHSLLGPGAIRRALDGFGRLDPTGLAEARRHLHDLLTEQHRLGGDDASIQRELAVLEHQLDEIDRAGLRDPGELENLLEEAKTLSAAESLRGSILRGLAVIDGEGGESPRDAVATVGAALEGFTSLRDVSEILGDAEAMLDDLSTTLRSAAERIEEDPMRLDAVNDRLRLLHDLVRRYGPSLTEVIAERSRIANALDLLHGSLDARSSLAARLEVATVRLDNEEQAMDQARQTQAPLMAAALRSQLGLLALGGAEIQIDVTGAGGDDVELRFSANRGHAPQPVAKVASGGELARLMLAIRLIQPGGPSSMVFDEVDAGIGGAAANTLALALREVSSAGQVLVVTHLAQVAAQAARQIVVAKVDQGSTTHASARLVEGEERIGEIARMLSGHPESPAARQHASELLSSAGGSVAPGRLV